MLFIAIETITKTAAHVFDPSKQKLETEVSEAQGPPQSHSGFQACLGYMRRYLK